MRKKHPLHKRPLESGRKSKARVDPVERRAKPFPIEMQVRRTDKPHDAWNSTHEHWHTAHLRYKRAYVYLCWREGKQVHTRYIGRAPNHSPTTQLRPTSSTPAPRISSSSKP